jgi:hypothetical protein
MSQNIETTERGKEGRKKIESKVVLHACNPGTQEAEAGGW